MQRTRPLPSGRHRRDSLDREKIELPGRGGCSRQGEALRKNFQMRIESNDKRISERPGLGVIEPYPAVVGVDSKRLSPEPHKRGLAQTRAQTCKDRPISLKLKVEAVAERNCDPKK